MALMVNGKKVVGYALGGNEYLSGAWFTDAKTLDARIKCSDDDDTANFSYSGAYADVYGFTYQDIGAGL